MSAATRRGGRAVPDRLSALDASYLYLDGPSTPMHVGSVAVFQAPDAGFDHERLMALVGGRLKRVPRYRQRVRSIPGRIATPVWVDDAHFDLGYHVRRSALPRPGDDAALADLVARVQSRPLDRDRPLWEMYLVEGLAGDRFALITKTHQAMVDAVAAVDVAAVILESRPHPLPGPDLAGGEDWTPAQEPSRLGMVTSALTETISRPTALLDGVRGGASELRSVAGRLGAAAGGLVAAAASAARPAPHSPLNPVIGGQRRFAMVELSLDDHRAVRAAHGGSVNDVVLATIAGALRAWLLTRGEKVDSASSVRAMVPVSVQPADGAGSRVASYLVDLPVGEANPVVRLHQVSYRMQAHKDSGQAVGAQSMAGLAGFSPPTLHALGARVASELSKRWFNLVVTNVPGPQQPLYAGDARLLATYPVVPLARRQAMSVGVTSYDGRVFYGLNADRDALPDLAVLAQCLADALAELAGPAAAGGGR